MKKSQMFQTPQKGCIPLILITILTIGIFIVSLISLLSGWQTIFQNLLYFPIILACVWYAKRGFVFSVILACGYFVLMVYFSNDPVVLQGAFIRVLIFILVAGVITYLSQIRIRAEKALKESEERYRKVADFTYDWEFWITPEGNFFYMSPSCERITGYSAEEFINDPTLLVSVTHPDDRKRVSAHICEPENKNCDAYLEYRIITKSGKERWISHNCQQVYNEAGTYLGRRAGNRDITLQKQAEEAIKESERRLTNIIDFLPDPTFVIDTKGKVIAWNYAITRLLGVGADEIIGKGNFEHSYRMFGHRRPVLIDLVIHGNETVIKKHYPNLKKERGMLMAELEIPLLNGKRTVLWIIATPLYNAKGEITGAIESMRDITHIHDTEVQLRESEQRLTDLIDFLPDPTFAIDTKGMVIAWNLAIEDMMGVSKADMIGKGNYAYALPAYGERRPVLIDLIQHEDKELEKKYTNLIRVGDQLTAEAFAPTLNSRMGEHIWMIASPLYDQNGTIVGAIESIRVITGRKRVEDAFKEANKKLNLLSSITRHDINNQLTVLVGYLQLLEKKIPDTAYTEYFSKISDASKRISSMIKFTKTYESIGVNAPVWQDASTLVEAAAKDIALGQIQLENDIPVGAEVFADPLVVKVFFNLLDNAVRYGKKITKIRFSLDKSGDDPLIVCEDDGEGVADDEKEKIFNRGFGKNTGLGLFLSREILAITGITIRETGEPGTGARFEILVPGVGYRSGNVEK
jgi:PAS domain S-box-containing protein